MSLIKSNITGDDLPEQCLAFTYDDGPGAQTLELAQYLYEQDVSATFFMVGKAIEDQPQTLAKLVRLGHKVANHTYSHADLTKVDNPTQEVAMCNDLIKPYNNKGFFYLRAPYGDWDADVAELLNNDEDVRFYGYTGPYYWNIGGTKSADHPGYNADWYCWVNNVGREECGDAYLHEIEDKSRGIVLMHDNGELADHNTFEMTKYLVPILKEKGYKFYPLSWIPQVADIMRDDDNENAMPGEWLDIPRGEHIDWHQIVLNGGSATHYYERATDTDKIYWDGTQLAGEAKEIAGRADETGLMFIFFMGTEDESKIWYQAVRRGEAPTGEFKEFETGASTSGLYRLRIIDETKTLKFEFWGREDQPKLWSKEQTHPGADEWSEIKEEQ